MSAWGGGLNEGWEVGVNTKEGAESAFFYRMFRKAPAFRRGDVRNGFAYIIQRLAV